MIPSFSMRAPSNVVLGILETASFENITVCRFPTIEEADFLLEKNDFIINVYDDKYSHDGVVCGYNTQFCEGRKNIKRDVNCLFYPIVHSTQASIESLISVVEFFIKNQDKKIVIHCRSGLHRSQMCIEAYKYVRDGGSINYCNMLILNMIDGYNLFPTTLEQLDKMLLELRRNLIS